MCVDGWMRSNIVEHFEYWEDRKVLFKCRSLTIYLHSSHYRLFSVVFSKDSFFFVPPSRLFSQPFSALLCTVSLWKIKLYKGCHMLSESGSHIKCKSFTSFILWISFSSKQQNLMKMLHNLSHLYMLCCFSDDVLNLVLSYTFTLLFKST